jgi:hypothetical protein
MGTIDLSTQANDTVTLPNGTVVTLHDLTGGYFRQDDYTKKTQALAEEKRAMQTQIASLQEKADAFANFKNTLEANPLDVIRGLQEHFQILPEQTGNTNGQPEGEPKDMTNQSGQSPVSTEVESVLLNEIRQIRKELDMQKSHGQLEKSFTAAKVEFPDIDQAELYKFAGDTGITDLTIAAKAMMFDRVKETGIKTEQDRTKAQLDDLLSGSITDYRGSKPSNSAGEPGKTFASTGDAIKDAIANVGLPTSFDD